MNSQPADNRENRTVAILRRGEQVFIAASVGLALLLLGNYCYLRGIIQNRLIEIDEVPGRHAAFKVDINQAEWPELIQLPEVGEATARRIVAERDRGGPFKSLEEIERRVHGVGPRLVEQITPYLSSLGNEQIAGPVAGEKAGEVDELTRSTTIGQR